MSDTTELLAHSFGSPRFITFQRISVMYNIISCNNGSRFNYRRKKSSTFGSHILFRGSTVTHYDVLFQYFIITMKLTSSINLILNIAKVMNNIIEITSCSAFICSLNIILNNLYTIICTFNIRQTFQKHKNNVILSDVNINDSFRCLYRTDAYGTQNCDSTKKV